MARCTPNVMGGVDAQPGWLDERGARSDDSVSEGRLRCLWVLSYARPADSFSLLNTIGPRVA